MFSRRDLLLAASLAGCGSRAPTGGCPEISGRNVRWIVPYAPGGSYEVYSRLLEPFLEKALGAEIVIANEPGNGSVVGASKLRDAEPDGRTLGILNAPGLLGAALAENQSAPDPGRDFALLGRLARSRTVIATAAGSRLRTIDDVIERGKVKPLLCAVTGVASNNMIVMTSTADILGLRLEYITGLSGSQEDLLSVMRGDTDLMSTNYESLRSAASAGDIRILLQISNGPIAGDPALNGVGWLAGEEGWAVRRAAAVGRTREKSLADAQALVDLIGAGIVVAAPKGVAPSLLNCLRSKFMETASSEAFRVAAKKARRSLEIASGEQAHEEIERASAHAVRFAPLLTEAIQRARK